jgi:purine-nucleoside phosphorylase
MSNPSETSAQIIQAQAGAAPIEYAFVLGTGLGSAMEGVEDAVTIPFSDLPGFPVPGVSGHAGNLVVGTQDGMRVAYMQGRTHYYETGDPRAMAVPLETLAMIGVQNLILTNSAGSVKADLYPRSLVLITDHINFSGTNPLIGMAADGGFVSMTEAYDPRLARRLKRAAVSAGVQLHEGVYMWFSGPSFETPAEIKMARTLGADVVGMSTVPEVIIARRLGLRVAAISIITNFGAGFQGGNPTHMETRETAMQGAIALRRLLRTMLRTKEEAWGIRQPGAPR